MKVLIQRVKHASVTINDTLYSSIDKGILTLVGIEKGDTIENLKKSVQKIVKLRIFADENDKMNLSLLDIKGEALVISNFTLCGDCKKGRRPFFGDAALPSEAQPLYDYFCVRLSECGVKKVDKGVFGADMKVRLLNDGPVTISINSKELSHK